MLGTAHRLWSGILKAASAQVNNFSSVMLGRRLSLTVAARRRFRWARGYASDLALGAGDLSEQVVGERALYIDLGASIAG